MQRAAAGDLWRIGVYPEYEPLRHDPRFIEIVKSLGVPNGYDPVTRKALWPEQPVIFRSCKALYPSLYPVYRY